MKSVYERTNLIITEFESDVITSSDPGVTPTEAPTELPTIQSIYENESMGFSAFNRSPGSW